MGQKKTVIEIVNLQALTSESIFNYYTIQGMGSAHKEPLANIDLKTTPVYCMGYSSDIHFAAQDESTNQVIGKLKQYEDNRLFKYRIRQQRVLQYFYNYSPLLVVIKPWRKDSVVLGIICINATYKLKVQNLMCILRKEIGIEQKQSIFLYYNGRLCQTHQTIAAEQQVQNKTQAKTISVLYYSKMEISG